ncbi:MAG: glycoside hydrolase family 99-like domain-containing protein [Bacteroidales bacterium]|nr:glycoside hydrolase family 99-like domain-containing protein [Bacteroidales bacterium]
MNRNQFLRIARTACCLLAVSAVSVAQSGKQGKAVAKPEYIVAAYVWPSCHDDPMGRKFLWGEGIGEWEVIKKGNPRFEGHYQPRQPFFGYEMDNDPKVVERWIDLATSHGVNTFVYDWYWYDGGPYLESALNDGFLGAPNNGKMNFYLMWANHDVKRNYWNWHRYGGDETLLWDARVDWKNFKIIVERVIRQYFTKPNYLKIEGCPVFSIFDIGKLMDSFGGSLEETRKAINYFRDEVKKAGFPDLHLQHNFGGGYFLNPESEKALLERVNSVGFNSVAMYNMGGFHTDYLVHGSNACKIREQWDAVLHVPLFPCVSVGWDDTPRFPAKGKKDVTCDHHTPASFAMLLQKAREYADAHPGQPKLITINAWNEWVEGSYLLPDMLHGFGYLEAVKKVISDEKYTFTDR